MAAPQSADAGDLVQKLEQAMEQKEMGTEALQGGDLPTALSRYTDAIALLAIVHQPPPSSEELALLWNECARQGLELELACRLNSALCLIKMEEWTKAVDAAGEAVRMDRKCAKAWFRRGVARAGNGQDDEAAADLKAAAKLAPQDKAIRRELAAAKARLSDSPQAPSAGAAAVSAAFAGGALYPEAPETPEARLLTSANLFIANAETARDAGKHAEGLAQCKRIFRLLRPGFPPQELALQRFRGHVIAAQCHKIAATDAPKPEARTNFLTRAAADLEAALRMMDGSMDLDDVIAQEEVEKAQAELEGMGLGDATAGMREADAVEAAEREAADDAVTSEQ